MKNYSEITNYLKENVLYRKFKNQSNTDWYQSYENQLKNDKVFNEILKTVDLDNIYPINIQSFANIHSPNKIRIRSDLFLAGAKRFKLNKIFVIFACINVNNIKTYVVITSNHFTSYSHSLSSSNSFFVKNFEDLKKWSNENGKYEINKRRVKGAGEIPVYIFWHGTENNIDNLKEYLNVLKNVEESGYYYLRRTNNSSPQIPSNVRQQVLNNYRNECSLKYIDKCLTRNSNSNDVAKEIHHIVARQYFEDNNITDSKIVNNLNNLMLLCFKCHGKLTSSSDEDRKKYLDYCLDVLKKENKFNQFQDYLLNVVHITIPILYRCVYGVSYE